MTNYSTQGLNDEQVEAVADLVIGRDKLYWLAPFLIGFWLNALLFGTFVVLFVQWQTSVARTEKRWVQGIVVSGAILRIWAT